MVSSVRFDEVEIQSLFGHEAAEDEDPKRLREYYFKSATYDQVVTDLPLRILVGHKGIGKSALFQVAMAELRDRNKLAVVVKPDDIVGLAVWQGDFLVAIRAWKEGILQLLARKAAVILGLDPGSVSMKALQLGTITDALASEILANGLDSIVAGRRAIAEMFLNVEELAIFVDDLDRGWEGHKSDVRRISALLNAVRDLANEDRGLRFRISLRSDVYFLVRTSDESTDKIEGSVVWQSWTNHEIFALLAKRIETFFGRDLDYDKLRMRGQRELARYLSPVFEEQFHGKGHWQDAPIHRVLMSLIRKRPRDLVKLCSLAARDAHANQKGKIYTQNLEHVFEEYSQGRIQDTINEFRSELPDIERLILNMRPTRKEKTARAGYVYTTADLLNKIRAIQEQGQFRFKFGRTATPKELAAFMYKINFLTARKEQNSIIIRKYFEEQRYLQSEFVEFGFDWEIHPAYRWALQPDDPDSIFFSLKLTGEG